MALPVGVTRHRFTTEEYRRMGEVGILHEDERVRSESVPDLVLPLREILG